LSSDNINKNDKAGWLEKGKDKIWLPYTQMKNCPEQLAVKSASGSRLILENGEELIDGISSWWSVCHGYQHPEIVDKMNGTLNNMSHVMFAGIAHENAYLLADKLINFTPKGLDKVFFADSGSTAIEVAMKMAVQYWSNKGEARKNKFISFRNGYHGDTMGALSLGDPDGWIAKAFNNYMPRQYVVDIPFGEYSFAELEETIEGISGTVAAMIIEPLVQGAGGLKFYSADILAALKKICEKNNILFIADEIMTGFYRTGNKFACDEAGITPDIMCLGKALTGGMISLAATLTSNKIFEAFLDDKLEKAFMHGPTFMANPLACSAALASLELFEKENYQDKVNNIEDIFLREFKGFKKDCDIVSDIRVAGAMAVIEFDIGGDQENWDLCFKLREDFVNDKVWLRPFKNVVYIMPNYNMSEEDLLILINSAKKQLIKNS
jgi:adenosylmethionine-8-amino-7-oxononanoate aminotransferase